jgi:DNA polymerase-3 subunit epsilon
VQVLRQIVLDTETTGTDCTAGDRIVEIGCVELLNHIRTGRTHHVYLNPGRAMSQGAFEVHGLSDDFLADKPVFAAIADELHAFFGDAQLVIHNASFDIGFLNAEFARTGHGALSMDRVVDTLALARRRHPGASNSLDALCLRYGIDNTRRTKHGALLDAELLADVYIELLGGRQADLELVSGSALDAVATSAIVLPIRVRQPLSVSRLSEAERERHEAFVGTLGADAIWRDYVPSAEPRQAVG